MPPRRGRRAGLRRACGCTAGALVLVVAAGAVTPSPVGALAPDHLPRPEVDPVPGAPPPAAGPYALREADPVVPGPVPMPEVAPARPGPVALPEARTAAPGRDGLLHPD